MTFPLHAGRIAELSFAAKHGLAVEVLASTTSTNAELRARIAAQSLPLQPPLQSPVLLAAEHQTAGRGRAGRAWLSVAGDSLCFSLAWRFQGALARLSGLSLAVGVAVAEALRAQGWPVSLKWPNDLLLDGAKLGGILIETASTGAHDGIWAVIGVGLNVHANADRDTALGHATASLQRHAAESAIDRNALLASIADALAEAMHSFDLQGLAPFVSRWHLLHAYQDCAVSLIDNGQILHEGIARGIDDSGRLLLDTGKARIAIMAGDVSLRGAQSSEHQQGYQRENYGASHAAAD